MITRENVSAGIDAGIIRFAIDPNMESGTVCQIGDCWFYFGGHTAEGMNPEEYLRVVAKCELVQEVYETLDSFRESGEELEDEYRYYDAYLAERLCPKKLWMRLGVVLEMSAAEAETVLDGTEDDAEETVRRIIQTGRFRAEGDSYIPQTAIQDFNDTYGTDYEEGEIGFDI